MAIRVAEREQWRTRHSAPPWHRGCKNDRTESGPPPAKLRTEPRIKGRRCHAADPHQTFRSRTPRPAGRPELPQRRFIAAAPDATRRNPLAQGRRPVGLDGSCGQCFSTRDGAARRIRFEGVRAQRAHRRSMRRSQRTTMAPPRALTPIHGTSITGNASARRPARPSTALPPSTSHVLQNSRAPAQLSLFQRPSAAR